MILDGDVSLRDEPLLRGSNGLCVYKKAKDGKTLRIREADGTWWSEEKVLKTLADLPKPAPQQTDPVTLHAKNDEAAERFLYQDDMMREPWRKEMFG